MTRWREIRAVSQLGARLAETARLGFNQAFIPSRGHRDETPKKLECVGLSDLNEMMDRLF